MFANLTVIFLSSHRKKPAPQTLVLKPSYTEPAPLQTPRGRTTWVRCSEPCQNTQPATYRPVNCTPHRGTNGTQRHTAQAERRLKTHPEGEHSQDKLADSSRVREQRGAAARRGGTSARACTQTHTVLHTHRRSHICNAYGESLPQPVTSPPPSPLTDSCPRLTPGPGPFSQGGRVATGSCAQGRGPAVQEARPGCPRRGGLGGSCSHSFGNAPAAGPLLQLGKRQRSLQILGKSSSAAGPQPWPPARHHCGSRGLSR